MTFKPSSLVLALLCTLLVFAALVDGALPAQPAIPVRPPTRPPNSPNPNRPNHNDPQPQAQKPLPKLPELPLPDGITKKDASAFDMGKYEDNQEKLFMNFDDRTLPFFSMIYDFFAAQPSYYDESDPYSSASGSENPFRDGQPRPTGQRIRFTRTVDSPDRHTITASFDPVKPTDACRAWSSLGSYCGDAHEKCACFSGTYYVPDQWNSLAAGCARATSQCGDATHDPWCQAAKTASSFIDYCALDTDAYYFGATANIKLISSDEPTTTETSYRGSTPTSAETTLGSTLSPDLFLSSTSRFADPTSSWASRSVDSRIYNWYPLFLVAMLALLVF